MQDKLIEAAQHVVDEMERGYPILGPVCRLKEALAAVRAHDAPETQPWWEKEWAESFNKYHAYAHKYGCVPDGDMLEFVLQDALAYRAAHDATDEGLRGVIRILRTTPIKPERGFECGTEKGIGFSAGFGHAIKILEKASASHAAESAPACPECGHNNVHGKYGCTWTHHDGEYDSSTERCNCKKTSLASTTNRAAEPVEDVDGAASAFAKRMESSPHAGHAQPATEMWRRGKHDN